MPKSLDDRLSHDDDLARYFEHYEPSDEDRRDTASHNALVKAVHDRASAERDIDRAVGEMRIARWSWSTIGSILGTSGQAAQQRYGSRASVVAPTPGGK
jgi:hypothetical protein